MITVSQRKNMTTESLSFAIIERQTCKNVLIDKETYRKFKDITQMPGDELKTKELKGLGEMLGKQLTKFVYLIVESKSNLLFGMYSSKERAKEVLKEIIEAYKNECGVYEMPKDENEEFTLI